MFWRFGGYANISTIDTILDKPDFTIEELLDESDLVQELKQHNTKLIEYLREPPVLQKLLEYVVASRLEVIESREDSTTEDDSKPKNPRLLPFSRPGVARPIDAAEDDDEQEKKRNRYAFVACEILSSDTWSIYEAVLENRQLIRDFWTFLSRDTPLDPLQASYFTKVNESLFEKKTPEMMDFLRKLPDAVPNLLKHVECPMIMDLLLKIIALDRSEGGQGIVEWLYSKNIIPTLLACLSPEKGWVVQTAAGEFIKAIITISANASQNEQQCIGPNELTRQLVSRTCVEQLISYMLKGGNPLTVGVGIIIEVIRKNNSDYDPDVGAEANAVPTSRDPIYLGTLLRLFADNVPNFMNLIMNPPSEKTPLDSTFGQKLEPLGFDRFRTCELMAELLHCSNMGLLNEVGSEQLISGRDAERNRLRAQGKLGPLFEEEDSPDELTMRISSSHDEGRRLEVTNADDDGFEEVEPSKEMSEDTSHEFVKAEADVGTLPAAPLTSFLEKDEEEFVDEPLSSPRLAVASDKVTEQTFEEPDLVVAPLSPTKVKSTAAGEAKTEAVESKSGAQSESSQSATEDPSKPKPLATQVKEPVDESEISPSTAMPPAPLVPQAADVPAPLFASDAQAKKAELPPLDTGDAKGDELSVSTILQPGTTDEAGKEDEKKAEPVVGDFLKTQFVEHRVVPTILSFFFTYPWNNFLHNVVYDIVQQVFNGPMDRGYNSTLAVSLFEAADVTSAIIRGQQASDESQARTKTRMGYMGHLTLIAEEVVKFTERHPPELLSETVLDRVMSQDWINYVEGALAETRERDNAILGGVRPEVALGHRGSIGAASGMGGVGLSGLSSSHSSSGSSALADAGLNGGIESDSSGNSMGSFAIGGGGGTLMSGFGSSSDEDEDDGDADEEDVNSEFRAYTEPLSGAGGSLDPPSIPPPPPPPPPLNIPPSRARLQLAARLAMHKNNQSAQPSSATLHNDGDDDDDTIDPFADNGIDDDDGNDQDRGSWWRGVLNRGGGDGHDSDDEDDEFGDFAMAEDDKHSAAGDSSDGEKVVLRPLAVNPAKESTRTLSGLWPFSSKDNSGGGGSSSRSMSLPAMADDDEEGHELGARTDRLSMDESHIVRDTLPDFNPVEVREAKSRTSIEDPDDDDDEYGSELMAGMRP